MTLARVKKDILYSLARLISSPKMVIVTTKKWHYQFRNETHVKKYSNGDDIEAEIDFGDDPGLASRFLEGEEKMVLSLVDGNEEVADEMSPLFLVFKPMIGE